ncbi:MAG: oxaloacetate decarboxylase, partial [Bacteroidales bacterium]|nr:oxaloacetate decarboxylase [Bacteroidales bacterium]
YPPLVTPFSQYVKNLALMNVTQLIKGKKRWSIIADDIWDMILGKSGRLPGKVDPEIVTLAKEQGREFYTGNPQDAYPDALEEYRSSMEEKGWDFGEDEEELFEYAMHPAQYEAYKSGKAKQDFEEDVAKRKEEEKPMQAEKTETVTISPQVLTVDVNGEQFVVKVIPNGTSNETLKALDTTQTTGSTPSATINSQDLEEIPSPLEGKFFLTKDTTETPIKVGDSFKKGDRLGYLEAMKTYNAILAHRDGVVAEITVANGDTVYEDDVLLKIR